MKNNLLFTAISTAALLTLLITSCSKKNDSPAYTTKQLAGTYKITAATASSGGTTIDAYQYMYDCQKTSSQTLNADSTYKSIDVCNSDTTTGKYVVKGNLLISDPDANPDTVTIKSFNGSQLVITFYETDQGVTYLTTTTLTKQ